MILWILWSDVHTFDRPVLSSIAHFDHFRVKTSLEESPVAVHASFTVASLATAANHTGTFRNCTFLFLWTLVVKVEADPHIWVTPLTSRSWRPVMLEIDIFASSTGELNIITVPETANLHDSGLCRLHRVREYDW